MKRNAMSQTTRFEVFKRDGFRCRYCGVTTASEELTVDHIIPVSKGGSDDLANLVTSCIPCNRGKSDRTLDEQPVAHDGRRTRLGPIFGRSLMRRRARRLPATPAPSEREPTPEEIQREAARSRLMTFIPSISPTYSEPLHMAKVVDRFERAIRGEQIRVAIAMPPRHTKSDTLMHGVAWGLRERPNWTFSYSTYADRLARTMSRKARAIAERSGTILESRAIGEWRNAQGGGLLAGGILGPLIGYGINVAIIDDPNKNRIEAESPTYQERQRDWLSDVLMTRLEPINSVFLVMHRWTPTDLIAHAVEKLGFELISMPIIDEATDTPLWPQRWSTQKVRELQASTPPYTWDSLFMQRPRQRDTVVFVGHHTYTELPVVYREAFGVDLAYTSKKKGDTSVLVKGMRGKGRDGVERVYITHVERKQVDASRFQLICHHQHKEAPGVPWRAYLAGTELGSADFFKRGPCAIPLQTLPPLGDKFQRSMPYASWWNAGRVLVPKSAPWLDDFLGVHAAFTGSGEDFCDDDVDAASAMFDLLEAGGLSVSAEVARPTRRSEAESLGV